VNFINRLTYYTNQNIFGKLLGGQTAKPALKKSEAETFPIPAS